MEPFVHCPLDLSKDEIRLARVTLPAPEIEEQRQEPVRIVLETFDRRTSPSYSALSYTWGPPSPSHGIVANDRPFTIRNNLYCFLRRLASGSIRYPATENDSTIERHPGPNGPNHEENAPLSPVYLWIDQLCIDQDSTTEKSSQVSKMTEIFMEAKEVIVWLGEEQDDSNFAMRCITQIPRAYKPWTIVKPDNNIPATVKMRARSSTTQVPLEEVVRSIQTLMNRPYWNRVWVAQEFLLARTLTIACGSCVVDEEDLNYFHRALDSSLSINTTLAKILLYRRSDQMSNSDRGLGFQAFFLWQVVCDFRHFHCFDPRDKIYGLLGLLSREERIEVDYDEPGRDLYWRVIDMLSRSYHSPVADSTIVQLGLDLEVTGEEQCTDASIAFFQSAFNKTPVMMFGSGNNAAHAQQADKDINA